MGKLPSLTLGLLTLSSSLVITVAIIARKPMAVQFLTGLEVRHILARQGNGIAGLGITALTRRTIMQRETAETTNLDSRGIHRRDERTQRRVCDGRRVGVSDRGSRLGSWVDGTPVGGPGNASTFLFSGSNATLVLGDETSAYKFRVSITV